MLCYVDEPLYRAMKAAADSARMSFSEWLKLAVIGVIEGPAAFRDRIMSYLLFTSTALDGLLAVQPDKDLRARIHAAQGKRLHEYRERIAKPKRGA